ncbi:nucleolin-like [Clytia hemisphaerica]
MNEVFKILSILIENKSTKRGREANLAETKKVIEAKLQEYAEEENQREKEIEVDMVVEFVEREPEDMPTFSGFGKETHGEEKDGEEESEDKTNNQKENTQEETTPVNRQVGPSKGKKLFFPDHSPPKLRKRNDRILAKDSLETDDDDDDDYVLESTDDEDNEAITPPVFSEQPANKEKQKRRPKNTAEPAARKKQKNAAKIPEGMSKFSF